MGLNLLTGVARSVVVELRMLLWQIYHPKLTAAKSSALYSGSPMAKAITAIAAVTTTNVVLLVVQHLVISIAVVYASAIKMWSGSIDHLQSRE
jgi:hypothetical protein